MGQGKGCRFDRRGLLKGAAAAGAALSAAPLFAPAVRAQARSIKLGYVSPQTGPLAAFAEADDFVIGNFSETVKNGIEIGGEPTRSRCSSRTRQSNPNRAAEVAQAS